VDAVRGDELRPEDAVLLEPRDDGAAVGVARLLDLDERLRDVRVQRHVVLGRERRGGLQQFGVRRVVGVRPDRRHDQGVALPLPDEPSRPLEGVLPRRRVG